MSCNVPRARSRQTSLGVDLRALKASAVVDVHGFPLAELVEHVTTGFAVSVPGVPSSAERELNLRTDGRRVDVDDSRVQLVDRVKGRAKVVGVHAQTETIL